MWTWSLGTMIGHSTTWTLLLPLRQACDRSQWIPDGRWCSLKHGSTLSVRPHMLRSVLCEQVPRRPNPTKVVQPMGMWP